MGTFGGAQPIVTDGLVFAVDAANYQSYPGSGTTWSDLSGNGNNGTLVNGPTYDGANGGSLVFDGANDYVSISNPQFAIGTSNFTLEAWCYRDPSANLYSGVISSAQANGDIGIALTDRTCWVGTGTIIQQLGNNSIKNFTDNVWFNVSFRRSNEGKTLSLKVNGEDRFSPVTYESAANIASTLFHIGKRYSNFTNFFWKGYIPTIKFYNRDLSDSEISQNYNALKGRFGL